MGKRAAVIALMCLLLSGCSLLFPAPPPELIAATEEYEKDVSALPGVKSAEAVVDSVDAYGGPAGWRVRLQVNAVSADGLSTLPGLVDAVSAPPGAELVVTLRFPSGPRLAAVAVTSAKAADIERVAVLRELPFAVSVGFYGDLSVELRQGTQLVDAVSAVRATEVLTSSPYDHVGLSDADNRLSVAVSFVGPSDPLVALIAELISDAQVQHVYSFGPSPEQPRARIMVDTEDQQSVVEALTTLNEPTVEGVPRSAFQVSADGEYISGFVGLPLGSAEPDDLPTPEAPEPTDPAVIAAQLAEDTVGVTAFLSATAESSGVPGVPEVFVGECQVQGDLLLEVFDHADSAQPAYDAIVADWEADGYTQTDQATGTSIYTTTQSRAVVELTIRGTAEGIRISAFGACRT